MYFYFLYKFLYFVFFHALTDFHSHKTNLRIHHANGGTSVFLEIRDRPCVSQKMWEPRSVNQFASKLIIVSWRKSVDRFEKSVSY